MKRISLLAAVITFATTLSFLGLTPLLHSQGSTTSLRGAISDAKGAVLPGATL